MFSSFSFLYATSRWQGLLSALLLLAVWVGGSGCGEGSKGQRTAMRPSKLHKIATAKAIETLEGNTAAYRWWDGKGTLSYRYKGDAQTVEVRMRSRKDSIVWLSLGLFGIEGARIAITPDSVRILNRLEKTYSSADFRTLQHKFDLPLTFSMLQDLLVGNAPDRRAAGFAVALDSVEYVLQKNLDGNLEELRLNGATMKLAAILLTDLRQSFSFNEALTEYEIEAGEGYIAPATRNITVHYGQESL